jgi:hypothetical protein
MNKPNIWNPETIENDILEYINSRADLKSRLPLTVELLKTFPGCENYTQEEAEFKLRCYDVIIPLLRDFNPPAKIISIDNQQVVNCINKNEPLKIAA